MNTYIYTFIHVQCCYVCMYQGQYTTHCAVAASENFVYVHMYTVYI